MYKFISKIISNFKEIFKPFEAKTLLPYNVNNIYFKNEEVNTYIINEAKWKQAVKFCEERNWGWRIITEKDINIY